MKELILGTRGSDLALAQARLVREGLEAAHPGLSIRETIITTAGDAGSLLPLHEPTSEGSGLFTRRIEEALLSGEIDLAVHSLKDLPVDLPAGLTLAAILPRAPVEDVLVSRHAGGWEGLPPGSTVGTSSPRRAFLLRSRRPDLRMAPIRGNVPTRLAKVASGGECDATVLAAAGLSRLGHDLSSGLLSVGGHPLSLESLSWMLPAPGQGAIAVETRAGCPSAGRLRVLHDETTARCVEAERLVLRHLGGGCHLALGAHATSAREMLCLRAVFQPAADAHRSAKASGPDPGSVALDVASQLLSRVP